MGTVTVTLTGDEHALLRSLDRVVAKQREVGESGRSAAKAHASALGDVDQALTKVVAGFSAAAIGKKIFDEIKASVDDLHASLKNVTQLSASQTRSEGSAFKSLAQLGPNAGFGIDAARRIKDQGGLSEQEAKQAVFGLNRAGLFGTSMDRSSGTNLAIKAGNLGLGGDAIGQGAALQRALGGKVSVQGVEQLLAQAQAVAPGSSGELISSLTKDASAARGLGISQTELLAAGGQLSAASSSPEQAARGLHQLLENFGKHHMHGSLSEMIAQAKARGGSQKSLEKRFGTHGLEALRSLDAGAIAAKSNELGGISGLGGVMGFDSEVDAAENDRAVRAQNARATQGRGVAQLGRETRVNQFRLRMRDQGMSEPDIEAEVQRRSGVGIWDFTTQGAFRNARDRLNGVDNSDFKDPTGREALGGSLKNGLTGGDASGTGNQVLHGIHQEIKQQNQRANPMIGAQDK